jgi:hypothetical protein
VQHATRDVIHATCIMQPKACIPDTSPEHRRPNAPPRSTGRPAHICSGTPTAGPGSDAPTSAAWLGAAPPLLASLRPLGAACASSGCTLHVVATGGVAIPDANRHTRVQQHTESQKVTETDPRPAPSSPNKSRRRSARAHKQRRRRKPHETSLTAKRSIIMLQRAALRRHMLQRTGVQRPAPHGGPSHHRRQLPRPSSSYSPSPVPSPVQPKPARLTHSCASWGLAASDGRRERRTESEDRGALRHVANHSLTRLQTACRVAWNPQDGPAEDRRR